MHSSLIRAAPPGLSGLQNNTGMGVRRVKAWRQAHFSALIPLEGTTQMGPEVAHRFCQPVANVLCSAAACQWMRG